MANEAHRAALNAAEERKKLLIAEGALYRFEIRNSKEIISNNLEMRAIANNILGRAAGVIGAVFSKRLLLNAGNFQTFLPLIAGSISTLAKNPRTKTIFRMVVVGGIIAATVSYVVKKKSRCQSPDNFHVSK